jgi:hypothetical protein
MRGKLVPSPVVSLIRTSTSGA